MTARTVTMTLNQQQLELLLRTIAQGAAPDLAGLAKRALREHGLPAAPKAAPAAWVPLNETRDLLHELVLEPGTGKALEVLKGQVLRIEQVEGNQCADFNCFNLHDYREFMHTGRTRTVHGLNPGPGDLLWSAPPRERAMMLILEDTVRCNDVMFPRCSAYLYESAYGFAAHTNCHDIQAEAQREYGLTPDDVHDSFNLFMRTEVHSGRGHIHRQDSKPGDHVDLLALMDVLAVPNVCGADIMRTSNFALKPLKVSIFQATPADLARVPSIPTLKTQRTPADFRQPLIKADRELKRDPAYRPVFTNVPLRSQGWDIALEADDCDRLHATGLHTIYGEGQDGDVLRDVIFSWWESRFLGAAGAGAPAI
jgi:uncharacterized protein YcgI (DUF1989 family)